MCVTGSVWILCTEYSEPSRKQEYIKLNTDVDALMKPIREA